MSVCAWMCLYVCVCVSVRLCVCVCVIVRAHQTGHVTLPVKVHHCCVTSPLCVNYISTPCSKINKGEEVMARGENEDGSCFNSRYMRWRLSDVSDPNEVTCVERTTINQHPKKYCSHRCATRAWVQISLHPLFPASFNLARKCQHFKRQHHHDCDNVISELLNKTHSKMMSYHLSVPFNDLKYASSGCIHRIN